MPHVSFDITLVGDLMTFPGSLSGFIPKPDVCLNGSFSSALQNILGKVMAICLVSAYNNCRIILATLFLCDTSLLLIGALSIVDIIPCQHRAKLIKIRFGRLPIKSSKL